MVDEYNVTLGKASVEFAAASSTAPKLTENGEFVTVAGTDFSVKFNKSSARLTEAKFKDDVLLTGGPNLNVIGLPLGEWTPDAQTPFSAKVENNQAIIVLNGAFGTQGIRFDITISDNGRIETKYTLTTVPSRNKDFSEIGVSYDLRSDVKSVDWFRDGLWSAYPDDHIGRNKGEALRVRPGSDVTPDEYGVKPNWGWEQDMRNFFLYTKDSTEDGISTNDFRAMREYIWYYNANFEGTNAKIQVESQGKDAARIGMGYSKPLTVDNTETNKITFTGSGWGHGAGSGFYNDTQSYSQKAGDKCTFTFEGTGVKFISSYQKNTGKAKIRIDGGEPKEIDLYNGIGTAQKQYVAYQEEGLSYGSHTIEVEVVGGIGDNGFIVIDAFQVLSGESSELKATLFVNNEWNYPALDWKNYTKPSLKISNGYTGTVTMRLTDTDDYKEVVEGPLPLAKNVQITAQSNALTVDFDIENGTKEESTYRWLKKKAGILGNEYSAIPGAVTDKLYLNRDMAGFVFICEVTPGSGGRMGTPVQSAEKMYGAQIVDDNATDQIIYAGDKVIHDGPGGYLAGTQLHNTTLSYIKKGTVSFTFNGTGIRWMGHKESNHGKTKITLDGVDFGTADQATSGHVYQSFILFEKTDLQPGEHTITLTNADTAYMSVDAFVTIDASQLPEIAVDELNKVLAQAGELSEKGYTALSWKVLKQAVAAAREMLEKGGYTQEQIDAAVKAITDAIAKLELKKGNILVEVPANTNVTNQPLPSGGTGIKVEEKPLNENDAHKLDEAIKKLSGINVDSSTDFKPFDLSVIVVGGANDGDIIANAELTCMVTCKLTLPIGHGLTTDNARVVRLHNDKVDVLKVVVSGDTLIFESDKFSTFEIIKITDNKPDSSYTGSSKSSSNGSAGKDWSTVRERIENASKGDTILVLIQEDMIIPASVIDTAAGKDIILVFDNGKEEVRLECKNMNKTAADRVYFTFDGLLELKAVEKAQSGTTQINPETGGEMITVTQAPAAEVLREHERAIKAPDQAQKTLPKAPADGRKPIATTAETATWVWISVILLTAATASGLYLWKKRS